MAGSINKCILVGSLGRDPEIRTLNSGDRVANLSLATSESWKDKATGERKEKTEWHRVVVFNDGIVKVCENYLRKGSTVYVEGSLATRKYEQNGVEKLTTEVVIQKFGGQLTMLGGKAQDDDGAGFRGGDGDGVSGRGGGGGGSQSGGSDRREAYDLNDDLGDIPFIRMASEGEA